MDDIEDLKGIESEDSEGEVAYTLAVIIDGTKLYKGALE